jgi:hypothetical protein
LKTENGKLKDLRYKTQNGNRRLGGKSEERREREKGKERALELRAKSI